MRADLQFIVATIVVFCLLAVSTNAVNYPVCGKNEILSPTPVCCEPTCTNDCSKASFPDVYVNEPVCVCKPGYVRHKSRCIRKICCPKNDTTIEPSPTTEFYPRYNEKPKPLHASCPCQRKPIPTTTKPYEPPIFFKPEPIFSPNFGPEPYIPKKSSRYDLDHLPPPYIPQKPSFDPEPTPKPYIPQSPPFFTVYQTFKPYTFNDESTPKPPNDYSYESFVPEPEKPCYQQPIYTTTEAPAQTTPYVPPTYQTRPPFTPCTNASKPEPPELLPKPCAPKCSRLQTLSVCRPCCIPTCDNDCSNVKCTRICIAELNCVCLAGYVMHEGKCIRKEDCPLCGKDKDKEYPPEKGYSRTGYTPRLEFSIEDEENDDCDDYVDK